MKMNRISAFINRETIYGILLFFILLVFYMYGVTKIIGFSLYPDEFGYWASAANICGWNWSEVASLGSYYSFGYSLILYPLLEIFDSSTTAYQAAIFVNVLLMGTGFVLLYRIGNKIGILHDKAEGCLLCMIAIFYPSWIFYMQMTLTEALLMFLFVLVTFLLVLVSTNNKPVYGVLLALFTGYLYTVHMRSVGVVIACVLVMFLLLLKSNQCKKCVFSFFITIIVTLVIVSVMKRNTIQEVYTYADAGLVAINDYSSKWWIFKELLTPQGMFDLLVSILGKIFYLGCASFGIFYFAMYALGRQVFGVLKCFFSKKDVRPNQWIALFLFLSVSGEVLICALGMYRPGYIDGLIYGRYSEFVMPILLIVGLKEMQKTGRLFVKCTVIAGINLGVVPLLLMVIKARGMSRVRGYHAVGLSYMLKDEYGDANGYLLMSWLLFVIVFWVIALIVYISQSKKNMKWLLCCIALIEFGFGMQASNHYVYASNNTNHMDVIIADTIQETAQEEDMIYFANDGRSPYIDFIQMQLRDKSISVINSYDIKDNLQKADYLIVYRDMELDIEFEKYFSNRVISNQYILYY